MPISRGRALCFECSVDWTPGDSHVSFKFMGVSQTGIGGHRTVLVSLPHGEVFPAGLPPDGLRSVEDAERLPGVAWAKDDLVFADRTPDVYAYSRESVQRNIFRIPLP